MNVFSSLKPHAMTSDAFWYAYWLHCSSLSSGLKRNFSSSAQSVVSSQSSLWFDEEEPYQ